jgi:exonuclease III
MQAGDKDTCFVDGLKQLKLANVNRIVIGHININYIRNKSDMLFSAINNNIDILMISETKIDDSFPASQFNMPGYRQPYRKDRNKHGGGILLYVREDLITKIISKISLPDDIECIFLEINLRKKKYLFCCTYNPRKSNINYHLKHFGHVLDNYCSSYDNFLIVGDLNSEISEPAMSDFCNVYDLKNLVKEPTCYKNPQNPTCIDLLLTN